jgi:hypothetical protein
MIIVTGTKRSGTSMWMQILKAAGLTVLGDAFPRDWADTLREANSEGFYESPLRFGIYYATNPHPRSGAFLPPAETREVAVKVFASGLVKSDLAYVHRVVASMRPFREYASSIARLYTIERENKHQKALQLGQPVERVPDYRPISPVLEWWSDNYGLVRDALIRRYPLHMVSYAAVLRAPERLVPETLEWLGVGTPEPAVRVVREAMRTQHAATTASQPSGLAPALEALFDEFYAHVDERRPLQAELIDRLNEAHDQLAPLIDEEKKRARDERAQALRRAKSLEAPGKRG